MSEATTTPATPPDHGYVLDQESLEVFAQKGTGFGLVPQAGRANGVKVRRVMQLITDLTKCPLAQLRILDLACGEGVYSIEAGLRGAEVLALDARTERMNQGVTCAERTGLPNVRFRQEDVRQVTRATHGEFDVVLLLGILYHLDVPDVFQVLERTYELCRQFLIVDTQISLQDKESFEYSGRTYTGTKVRQHGDHDTPEQRRARLLMSVDNTFSVHFTRESLVSLLADVGYTSVLVVEAPFEAYKPANRITVVAFKGTPVYVATYPWVNGKSEEAIRAELQPIYEPDDPHAGGGWRGIVKRTFRKLGFEIKRIGAVGTK